MTLREMIRSIRSIIVDEPEPEPEPCDLTIDEVLHLFSNERRRYVVELVDTLGPMQLAALADAISAITGDSRKGIYVGLYQDHLPKLDQHGVIELGERGHQVDPGPEFDACAEFVSDMQDRFDPPEDPGPKEFEYDELEAVVGGEET